MDYKCPKCNKKNKLMLMGRDCGVFEQKCKHCNTSMDININDKQKIDNITFGPESENIENEITAIPSDYKKMENKARFVEKRNEKKDKIVVLISFLILSASIMGIITGSALYYSPDEFPESEEIRIEIIIKNNTSDIDNATILINHNKKELEDLGNGSYQLFLKPGRYQIRIEVSNHTSANAEVYIPPQDNNLSLVDYDKGLEGVNLFTFKIKEGDGEETLDSNTYHSMIKWCPGLMFIFSLIGVWGAWITYTLQSYKNAQIGAFFSILAMGLFIVGPILGITALFLLPKIKKLFTVHFKN